MAAICAGSWRDRLGSQHLSAARTVSRWPRGGPADGGAAAAIAVAIWFCSINFLVRVFNQEQALVAGSLTGIVRDPTQTPCQLKTWFVHSSLSEIDQVRASFLQGRMPCCTTPSPAS